MEVEHLISKLKRIPSRPLELVGYRSVSPQYAREIDILSGHGSRKTGGRWNSPGIAAVYASETPELAMKEVLAHHRYYGIPIYAAMPRVFVAIEFNMSKMLDLTFGENRQRLGISEKRLLECDWRKEMVRGNIGISQTVGDSAYETGFEGMIIGSSQAKNGVNIIVFPDNLTKSSFVKVRNAEKLEDR